MADKNRQTGPSEVEQGKNANGIFDQTDDIPEAKTVKKEPVELERGEELYTGFGFGNIEAKDVEVPEISEKEILHTKENNKINDIEQTFEGKTKAVVEDKNSNLTIIDDREKSVKNDVKITTNNTTNRQLSSKITSESREVPKDTKLVIESDKGNIRSHQTTISRPRQEPTYLILENDDLPRNTSAKNTISRKLNGEYLKTYEDAKKTRHQQNPDYELSEVYYTKGRPSNPYSLTNNYTPAKTIDPLSIKNHYKIMKKHHKVGLPWGKIALGLAATIGAFKVITAITDDEDEGFIF